MIKHKYYRWANCMLGARSFKKQGPGGTTYALVKGEANTVIQTLISQGFVEEWPKNYGGK